MLLSDFFCYLLLMITMTEPWAQSEKQSQQHLANKLNQLMSRRDSTILVDPPPGDKLAQRSKVIYRRLSKKRQAPRATYGPPKPKYGPPRSLKKPGKSKYRSKAGQKRPYHSKVRAPKPTRHSPAKWQSAKPVYGPPRSHSRPPYLSDGLGFAEPPSHISNAHKTKTRYASDYQLNNEGYQPNEYDPTQLDFSAPTAYSNEHAMRHSELDFNKPNYNDFENPKQSYGEPPVDSYGAPIKYSLHDLAHNPQNPPDLSILSQNFGSNNNHWQSFDDGQYDNHYANSMKHHAVSRPDHEMYIPLVAEETNDEQNLNSYSDIYNARQVKDKKKKKPSYYENVKVLNRPWTGSSKNKEEVKDEIIVGGQYAEPPARFIQKFPGMDDDDRRSNPSGFSYPDVIQSPTVSSYVNYKNSNLAFSPQNLNDVFSIVDK